MQRSKLVAAASLSVVVGSAASSASALAIVLDYSNDGGYFNANPAARATLQRAASDIGTFITTTLGATTDANVGVNGQTTATFDHTLYYTNPSTGAQVTVANAAIPADQFRVYVGRRNLTGTTLAQGGPGGYGVGVNVSGFGNQFQGALNNGSAASTANLRRGGGPTFGTVAGSVSDGTTSYPYAVTFGDLLGNLWFDSDTNDDGAVDADAAFNAYFQTDYTQPVGAGRTDLYSVALHEMLHSLGFGTSQTWNANLGGDGNDWLGANVNAILGAGNNNAVSVDLAHVNGIYNSVVLGTSTAQAPVMVPSIGTNQRRFLTNLDAAFLRDINYAVVTAVPEPTTLATLALAALGVARRRRRRAV